jgi:N utilization substance protein B|tara:strand:+ start:1133 stop:1534 length:402 start_codon:yes stop_codon:yes gene_type:complete
MQDEVTVSNPRVIVVQKIYAHYLNKDSKILFPKHKYRKFIKDVVNGSIERKDLIDESIDKHLKNDINENKTDLMVKIMIVAAIYEFMYMHRIPVKVIINEYLKVADLFVKDAQKSFLNAILDKISKVARVENI